MERPRVTAITPAWNAELFIEQTLRSLAAQTYPNLWVLVSDDASADSTAEICERFAQADPRFRVVRRSHNLGWVENTNALLRMAEGDYLFFAFHDDEFEPTYVARLVERLEANPAASVAFSDMVERFPDSRRVQRTYTELEGVKSRFERARRILQNNWFWWVPFRGVFRASVAREIGGLRKHWRGEFGADWPWLLGLALRGEFERVAEPLCVKRIHTTSLSAQWRYTILDHAAVGWECARAIERSDLRFSERLKLHAQLAWRLYRRSAPVLRITRALGFECE